MERENNTKDRILNYDEEERLLKVCPQWLQEIVTFALHTVAREGEILELTWKDMDPFRKLVTIHQGKRGENKTVPLTSTAFEILKSKAKVRHLHRNLVFPSETGTRITDTNFGRAFRSALKKAKFENLRFHALRHYAEFWIMPSDYHSREVPWLSGLFYSA